MRPLGMRFPLLEPKVVLQEEFDRKIKTRKILVDVDVLSQIFKYFLVKGREEAACLLRGTMAEEYLVIKDIHKCKKSTGTRAVIDIQPIEFCDANKGDGYYTVGWVHSHPQLGVWMSGRDIETQRKYFQSFFPDAVAMVMDPLSETGIAFDFFRVINGKARKVDYEFLVRRDV
jgi:proteasome lid subunit RPN8/RPN11